MNARCFVASILLALGISAVHAQFQSGYGNWNFNNPMSATLNKMTWDSMSSRLIYKTGLKRKGYSEAQLDKMSTDELKEAYIGGKLKPTASSPTTAKPKPPAKPATRFVPTKTRVLMPLFVDSLTQDSAQRKELKTAFEGAIRAYEKEAANAKLPNDMAAAMAYFVAATYELRNEAPTEQAANLLVAAIQLTMDTPELRKVADIEKQKFYEYMVTMASYLAFAKTSLTDESQLKALQSAADKVLKRFTGIDPDKVMLTENGLVTRKEGVR